MGGNTTPQPTDGETITFPRELTDDIAELIAMKARVCGGGAYEIWEELCKHGETRPAQLGGGVVSDEMDEYPKELISELRGPALRENALRWRGERNRFRNLYLQARTKSTRLEQELIEARKSCERMRIALEAALGKGGA